jgi:predicted RNA-binding Zn ribbon-like protein
VEPLFLGSHPAIDFLNTTLCPRGERMELIGDGRSFVEWLAGAGLLDPAMVPRLLRRLGGAALDQAAAEARRFREWVRAWIARWQRDPDGGDHGAELRRLNAILEKEAVHRELVATPGGCQIVERCRIDTADQLIGLVAVQVARLIASEDPSLVKTCAGPECTLWFLDRTKARRRLFCSAAACGNRAKVAAFRERQRAG